MEGGGECHVRTGQDLAELQPAKIMKILKVRNVINADCRRTTDEMFEITGLPWSLCQRMLTEDLNMKSVSAKFFPRLLTRESKQHNQYIEQHNIYRTTQLT